MPLTAREHVEWFHLLFLRALVAKGEDKALFALKGGCNLRFFFESVRYSEDIDFDVAVISMNTLKNKVDRILRSPMITSPLSTRGVECVELSAPKQTDTTQRWKAGLRVAGFPSALRTKIEFSRRAAVEGVGYEAVGRTVLRPYAMTPFLAPHYTTAAAIAQKIHALAGRRIPQARDLFDLNLLFARSEAETCGLTDSQKNWLPQAIERAMELSFDEYNSKVVAYLEPGHAELYGSRASWEMLQATVVSRLEALQ